MWTDFWALMTSEVITTLNTYNLMDIFLRLAKNAKNVQTEIATLDVTTYTVHTIAW